MTSSLAFEGWTTDAPQARGSKRCHICSESLKELLNEIQQDISYANKTITFEKLSSNRKKKLYDFEDAYTEHSLGLRNSQSVLTYSLDNLASLLRLNKTSDIGAERLTEFIAELENDTLKLQELSYRISNELSDSSLISNLEFSFVQHINRQIDLVEVENRINFLNTIELNSTQAFPFVAKLFAKQSNIRIAGQIADGASLESIYLNASRQVNRADRLLDECRSYRHSRAINLVGNSLLSTKQVSSRLVIRHVGADMAQITNETLRQSKAFKLSSEARRGSAGTSLSEALDRSRAGLVRLAQRLNESNFLVDRLKLDLPKLNEVLDSTRNFIMRMRDEKTKFQHAHRAVLVQI